MHSTKKSPNPLVFKIAKIWGRPEGSTEKHELDLHLDFDPKEISAVSNLTADLMIIKLKDELSVLLSNGFIEVNTACSLCLKEFVQGVKIRKAERQFLKSPPSKFDENSIDQADIFLIDLKGMSIDLSEMIRQEIILHFASFPVCSDSCKGLCQYCGQNKNEKSCKCKPEDLNTQSPFKDLKKLLKNK